MTRIYWFSGTGNSYSVAKHIADAEDDAQLLPIPHTTPHIEEEDVIGLVFPVYAFAPPQIVKRFMSQLPPDVQPAYLFIAATYASIPGAVVSISKSLLKKKGLTLDASFGVKMPENYPPFGGAPPVQKQQQINEKADQEIEKIVHAVKMRTRNAHLSCNILFRMAGRVIDRLFSSQMKKADKKFKVNDACTQCGLCAEICPADNIKMEDGTPQWQGHCEQCYACFHWCPPAAIQYGTSEKQVRYHHPDCTLQTMKEAGGGE